MISKEPLRVRIVTDRDAMDAIEAVEADGVPRVIERDGQSAVKIVSVEDRASVLRSPSPEGIERALKALGGWKNLGGDELSDAAFALRHDSPERPPLSS